MDNKRKIVRRILIVAIIGIIAALAVPGWMSNRSLRSAAGDLYGNFQKAKAIAIKTNANCTISFYQDVPPMNGPAYDYVVYVDKDNDLELDDEEEVITKVRFAKYDGVDLDISRGEGIGVDFAPNDGPNLPSIAFLPNGLVVDSTGAYATGKVFLRNLKNKTAEIELSSEGKIKVR